MPFFTSIRPKLAAARLRPVWWWGPVVARVGLLLSLGVTAGCKFMMPAEIRGIQSTLDTDSQAYERENTAAFHDYRVGQRPMHFAEAGAGPAKPLVLFVHGSPGDWRAWVEYLRDPELKRRAHMIAVDRPGFGGSGAGKVERSLVQQCRDIEPLLDRAGQGRRVVLVGHSFGGPVVCRLAMDHPDKVTDVIVLAGSIDPGQERTKWYQYPAEWWVFRWMIPKELKTTNREIRALKAGLVEMLPLWQNIRQRVTVVQGDLDDLVPPENADFAERMMIHARPLKIIRIPGMNHFLPWKQFDLVKAEVLKHLD